MDIYKEIKSLRLPQGKYVVFGGSALEGYGIRKSGDIDIAVTEDIYADLKNKGWKEIKRSDGRKVLEQDRFEIAINFQCGNYKISTNKLIKTATIIKGVPFADLNEIITFKKALNRDKDKLDIKLIQQYLESRTDRSS